jgi:hypothetical protein
LDTFVLWLVVFGVMACVGAENVTEVLEGVALAPLLAALCDYFLTPYVKVLHTVGGSLDEVRRRRVAFIGLIVFLVVVCAVPIFVPMGS